jgi:hypothetical protein
MKTINRGCQRSRTRAKQRGYVPTHHHHEKLTEEELLARIRTISVRHSISGNEQLQTLKDYFSQYSINEYLNKEDILHQIYAWLESPDSTQNKLGLSCFIAILCQCRSSFSLEFSKVVLEKISHLFQQTDAELFLMCLHIAVHISGTTLEQTRLVQRLVPMSSLVEFILQQQVAPPIVHKALYLFGNYCRASDRISAELADFVCRVITHIMDTFGNVYEMVRESVWLCGILIAHHYKWSEPVEKYGILERFNKLLMSRSSHIRSCLLPLIGEMSSSLAVLETFDLGFIVRLVSSETGRVDVHAISCLRRCVEHHSHYIHKLVDFGLVEQLAKCIRNGSIDGRIESVGFLLELSNEDEFPLIEVVTNWALLDELLEMIPQIVERSGLTILRLLWKCVRVAQSSGTVEEFAEYLEGRELRIALEEGAEDSRSLIANTSRGILDALGWSYV